MQGDFVIFWHGSDDRSFHQFVSKKDIEKILTGLRAEDVGQVRVYELLDIQYLHYDRDKEDPSVL